MYDPRFPDDLEALYQSALGGGVDPLQLTLPGELAKQDIQPLPPPPPPPPPQRLMAPGVPVADEVPAAAMAPPLSPEEEAQIQIDPPQHDDPNAPAGFVTDQGIFPAEAAHGTGVASLNPDAVSGGTVAGQQAQIDGFISPPPPDAPLPSYGPGGLQPATETPENYLSDYELGQKYSTLSPDEQFQKEQEQSNKLQNFRQAREIEINTNALREAQENARIYHESVQQAQKHAADLDAEATAVANKSPLDTISTGRKIAGVLAAVVGGFAMNKTGRNVGLEAVDSMINEAAAEQATKLQNLQQQRRGAAENINTAGDLFRTQEAMRLGMYDQSIRGLEAEVQQYDPRGTTAIRTMRAIGEMKAKRQQYLLDYQDRVQKALEADEKSKLEIMKAYGQQAKDIADTRKTEAETAKLLGQLGGGAKPKKFEDTPMSLAQLRQLGVAIPDGVAEPAGGLSLNQAKKLAETGKSAEDWNKASRENSPEDLNRKLAVGEVFDDQGNPVKFRDETFAGKLASTKADVATGVALIDEMIRARNDAGGWTSDLVKSDKWRNAQQAAAAWLLKSKNADQLGVLSGSDLELEMKKLTGGADLTGMRDPIPQLINARAHMLNDLHEQVAAQAVLPKGRHVTRWEPPNMANLKATEPLVQGKTGVEQGEGARHPLAAISFTSNEERQRKGEERADVGPTGLDKADDARVTAVIKEAQSGGADAVQRLADAASTNRDSVNAAVLARVRTESPDLYKQVVAKLSPAAQKDIADATPAPSDIAKISFDTMGPDQLAPSFHDDEDLRRYVIDKALNGNTTEKRKAAAIIGAATQAGSK